MTALRAAGDQTFLGARKRSPIAAPFRALFDLPDGKVYFDASAYALPPRTVAEAAIAGATLRTQPWRVTGKALEAQAEEIRALAARLINASPGDIALVRSTSYGVATAALNLPLAPGEAILVIDGEHPSQVYPWLDLASRHGGTVEEVRASEGGTRSEAIITRLAAPDRPRVAILALTPVQWADGELLDLDAVFAAARRHGARVVLDATQALGVLPIDVQRLKPDFLISAFHKWLLGPQGFAILYAAPEHQHGRPLDHHAHARAIDRYAPPGAPSEPPFLAGARRYDAGQRADMVAMPMAIAGLGFVLAHGVEGVRAHVARVTSAVAEQAADLGFSSWEAGRRAPHILGLRPPPGASAGEIGAKLLAEGVHLSARQGLLRVSPYLFNDESDVARLVSALAAVAPRSSLRP
ncbi:MAG: aminotransferase class V-fold PLP-dependent enzyme [Rhizobiales bacterium]|nr:aminotransferase class V-fold PLP-dependent enzyme [Hyphomicrobiales bacterium]